jgi:hypothetical protein
VAEGQDGVTEGAAEGGGGAAAVGPAPAERRAEAERVVRELLGHMGFAARLELRDMPDGGIGMAVHFEGEPPQGVQAGRRTPVMDALQFIANKLFNKPGQERRWLSLAAFALPEPRVPGGGAKKPAPAGASPEGASPAAPAAQAPAQSPVQGAAPVAAGQGPARPPATPAAPSTPARPAPLAPPAGRPAARPTEVDERSLSVAEDTALAQEARALAEKAAKLGRYFALQLLGTEDRARVLQAAAGVPGVRVHVEGEGRHRRIVFTPDKPAPLPKRNAMPDWDDEEEDDEEGDEEA